MLYRHFHGLRGMFEQLDAWFRNYRFSWMLRSFFVSLPAYVRRASYDPVAGDRLDEYLDNRAETTKREVAFEKARRASTLAKRAYSNRTRDDSLAMQAWRELMG